MGHGFTDISGLCPHTYPQDPLPAAPLVRRDRGIVFPWHDLLPTNAVVQIEKGYEPAEEYYIPEGGDDAPLLPVALT